MQFLMLLLLSTAALASAVASRESVAFLQQVHTGEADTPAPSVSKLPYFEERGCRRFHDTSRHRDWLGYHSVYEGFYVGEVNTIYC